MFQKPIPKSKPGEKIKTWLVLRLMSSGALISGSELQNFLEKEKNSRRGQTAATLARECHYGYQVSASLSFVTPILSIYFCMMDILFVANYILR